MTTTKSDGSPETKPKLTWGGARPGAGRPRVDDAARGFIAHKARPPHRRGGKVRVTLRAKKGIPSLRGPALARIVKDAVKSQREQLVETGAKHFKILDFTIEATELHLVVEAPDKRGLARGVAGISVRVARRINTLLGRTGQFWEQRYQRREVR